MGFNWGVSLWLSHVPLETQEFQWKISGAWDEWLVLRKAEWESA